MKYIQKINARLDFLNQNISIDLKGRNLILTGKNGIGKTRFLNQLNSTILNKLTHEIPHITHNQYILKINIVNMLKNNFLELNTYFNFYNHIKFLENLLGEPDSYNIYENKIFQEKALELKNIIVEIMNTSKQSNSDYHHIHSNLYEIDNLFNQIISTQDHENIHLVVNGVGDLNQNIQSSKVTFNFFPAHRQSKIASSTNTTDLNEYIDSAKFDYSSKLGHFLEQYLLNIRIEKSLALSEENDSKHAYEIDSWFEQFDEDLKFLFEDQTTKLNFDYKKRKFTLKQSYREFTFQSLSSGFTAVFDIYSDLLMRSRLLNILPNELNGVVLIDEIDAHLHISLQKKILPFLTKSFPEVQFIVSTHSPFVITSTNNDTVVYDISSGEFFEDDLSLYSHESIIKELFHVEATNENVTKLSNSLINFIENEDSNQNLKEIQEILYRIGKDFDKLPVEAQLQYMVAKNKIEKLKHEAK